MVQAGWAEEARRAAQPSLLPLAGLPQNDTPSPVFFAWDTCERVGACLTAAIATLAVVASQALHERGRPAPPALAETLAQVRAHVPVVVAPRSLGRELGTLAASLA
jgi:histidine ammonia-lyase